MFVIRLSAFDCANDLPPLQIRHDIVPVQQSTERVQPRVKLETAESLLCYSNEIKNRKLTFIYTTLSEMITVTYSHPI